MMGVRKEGLEVQEIMRERKRERERPHLPPDPDTHLPARRSRRHSRRNVGRPPNQNSSGRENCFFTGNEREGGRGEGGGHVLKPWGTLTHHPENLCLSQRKFHYKMRFMEGTRIGIEVLIGTPG